MLCRQFTVRGRVQGVFFRASTRDVAVPMGLTGYANNMPDGSVEVLACGEQGAVSELQRWLSVGPPMATVSEVEAIDVECVARQGFSIA